MARSTARGPEPIFLRKQDWAYDYVREQIVSGALAAGAPIEQSILAVELGISRIPLREALARLETEGWVVGQPHHGLIVAENSIEDARDIYAGRIAIESTLAGAAAQQDLSAPTPQARLRAAQDALHRQESLLSGGPVAEMQASDSDFHMAIYEIAGLPKTLAAARTLYGLSGRYLRLYLQETFRSADSFHEHGHILDAVTAGDAERAAELTRAHVTRGLRVLEQNLFPSEDVSPDLTA